jgi:hypothetical protein
MVLCWSMVSTSTDKDVGPDDVGEGHVRASEDRFEVVECESELSSHVARMLRGAVASTAS